MHLDRLLEEVYNVCLLAEQAIGKVTRSTAKGKKYKVVVKKPDGSLKTINFGAKGYSMAPGTSKGDNYCARSSGIKGTDDRTSANYWARKLWRCRGKKSI